MFSNAKGERQRLKDNIFSVIMKECVSLAPKARLSQRLRSRLERLPLHDRKELMKRLDKGRTPLLAVCQFDNVEVVDYFIKECGADVDQKGLFEVFGDKSIHYVSPLWCAAVNGCLSVVKCLVEHGADVNSMSDTGSTPVRSACFMTNFDVVVYLTDHNADISKPNYNGGTCLINSVQSPELCELLLKKGADPNAFDIQKKTALHYAIQEQRVDSTKLLLKYGSDPYMENRFNDDALRTAALKGAEEIVHFLVKSVSYPFERTAEAYELLGSTVLEDSFDIQLVLLHWRRAIEIRETCGCLKKINKTGPHYNNCIEFQTYEELSEAALDMNEMRMQSLLICERILGNSHKETLYRIMQRGAAYADSCEYDRCLKLWLYIFELRVQSDTLVNKETCFAAQALVRLFRDMLDSSRQGDKSVELSFDDIFKTLHLICSNMHPAMKIVSVHPKHARHMTNFDICMGLIIQLVYVLKQLNLTEEQDHLISRTIYSVVKLDPRSQTNEWSFLHLVVVQSYLREKADLSLNTEVKFPFMRLVKYFIDLGAIVDSLSDMHITPLRVAATQSEFNPKIVQCLLDHGAHIDRISKKDGKTPLSFLEKKPTFRYTHLKYRRLTCLCAAVIKKHNIKYLNKIPQTLEPYVEMH